MLKNNSTKQLWFRTGLVLIILLSLIILIGRAVILSHSRPLRFYLEFLGRNSQREQAVVVYSKEEFAKKYLGLTPPATYQAAEFLKLFQAYYKYPPVKKNNLFLVYKVPDSKDACKITIFGVSEKKDLVYVSNQNLCLKNEQKNQ